MSVITPAHLGQRYLPQAATMGLSPGQASVRDRLLSTDPADDWEHTACLCGDQGGRVMTDVDRHGLPYRKLLCSSCGLLRVSPRWTARRYARFYEEDYRDLYSPLNTGADPSLTLQRLAAGPGATLVSEFVKAAWKGYGKATVDHPTIVEIGAGGGWNLSRLPPQWTRIGFDSDDRFLRLGREAFGVDMRRGFFDEALPEVARADCVLLSHVLEHVADPVATLARLREVASQDALILIEVPGIFRLHKTGLDPMRYWQNAHTFTFCARTITDTCRRAGLEPLAADEWIRLVLRPSQLATRSPASDPAVARSIESYLRYCEGAHGLAARVARWPLIGGPSARMVRLGSDALMRLAMKLQPTDARADSRRQAQES